MLPLRHISNSDFINYKKGLTKELTQFDNYMQIEFNVYNLVNFVQVQSVIDWWGES